MRRQMTKDDIAIAKKLRTIRILSKVSQEMLASTVGTTFQQIQKYETGMNRISAGMLVNLARGLGVCVTDFFDEDQLHAPITAKKGLRSRDLDEIDWRAVMLLNEFEDQETRVKLLTVLGEIVAMVKNERGVMKTVRSKIGARRKLADKPAIDE